MNIAAIVNPASRAGSRNGLLHALERGLAPHLFTLRQPETPEEATRLAAEWAASGADAVVAVGGDGTVNAVVNGLAGTPCRLGVVPVGTGNDLARSVGLPTAVDLACRVILRGAVRRVDAVRVNGWHFVSGGGLGLPVEVLETVGRLRRRGTWVRRATGWLGSALYPLAMLYRLRRCTMAAQEVDLQLDGSIRRLRVHALLVTKVRSIGRHMCVAPDATPEDGRLHVFALKACGSRLDVVRTALSTLSGNAGRRAGGSLFSARRLVLSLGRATPFCADGETRLCSSAYHFEVIPGGVTLLCPGESDR